MKILISHVYSNENKGDAALLSVLLSDVRRAFDSPEITVLTLDKIAWGETFEGAPVKNSFMHYVRDRYRNYPIRLAYGFFLATSTLLWAWVYRMTGKELPLPGYLREIAVLYKEADLIIPVGGGYLGSNYGFMPTANLAFIVHPFLFAHLLGKPTINYAQSVGPFGNKIEEHMAKFAVRRLTGIIVRENISFQLLQKWGVTKNVLLSVDSGFLFTSSGKEDFRKELGISDGRILIGITVRNWLKGEKQVKYEETVAKLCDYIVRRHNAVIIFIPQVTVMSHKDDDRESSQRVYGFMEHKKHAHVIIQQYDHNTIKAAYGSLDYLIGTRFHSIIFALTAYVPSIAIEYEYKTRGIMADLGLEKWVVDIQKIDLGHMIKLFDELIAQRDHYIDDLKKYLPSYMERARQSIFFVREVYETHKREDYLLKIKRV
jgi:colanic acid/amylovoran biosynthesis protein